MTFKVLISNSGNKVFKDGVLQQDNMTPLEWKQRKLDRSKITSRMSQLQYLSVLSAVDSNGDGYVTEVDVLHDNYKRQIEELEEKYQNEIDRIAQEYQTLLDTSLEEEEINLSIFSMYGDTLMSDTQSTYLIPKFSINGKIQQITDYTWYIDNNEISGARLFLLVTEQLVSRFSSSVFRLVVRFTHNGEQMEREEDIQINNLISESNLNNPTNNGNGGVNRGGDNRGRNIGEEPERM